MNLTKLWTIELKNGIYGGLKPIIDPFDEGKFYIADGWGSAYPSMKLRQLSFENGKELKTVLIKNSVRCLYFTPDQHYIFAVSDNKIFQIDRTDFAVKKKFEKGIQKYNDYIASNDKDTLLLMNFVSDFLFVYNYKTEKGIKKKLKSCRGIIKDGQNNFLIFSSRTGTVLRYDLATNKLTEALKLDIYCSAYKGNSGKFYFHCGKIVDATSNTHEEIVGINKVLIVSPLDKTLRVEISFEFDFSRILISENEDVMYLLNKNRIWVYSFKEKQIIDHLKLNEEAIIAQLFDKKNILLSYDWDNKKMLTCWRI